MEPEGSPPCSQEPATCPYSEPNESNPFFGFHKMRGIFWLAERTLKIQINSFKYLCYYVTCESEKDIPERILNHNRAMGVIIQVFKPSLVQKHNKN
jgi:hypothetical protein